MNGRSSGKEALTGVARLVEGLCSDENLLTGEEPAHYRCSPVWKISPEERIDSVAQWYPHTKKLPANCRQLSLSAGQKIYKRLDGIPINNGSVVVQNGGVEFPNVAGRNDAGQHAVIDVGQSAHHVDDWFN